MKILRLLACLLLAASFCVHPAHAASQLDRIAQTYLDGDAEKALTQLEAYLKKRPADSLAWTIKGNILTDLDRDAAAEQAYHAALKANPKAYEALCSLGILRRRAGDYDGAIAFYKKALEINPDYAQAYSSMVTIELKRGNDAEALRVAQLAYTKDQEDATIAANLAIACHYNGKTEQRDKYTRIAKELGYKNIETLARIYSGELTIRDE
jgi:tetratricopeptide (TPR) repeat protein